MRGQGRVLTERFRYVYEDVDRHGSVRIYFWRGKGHRKVRLREKPGTLEFRTAYEAAKAASGSEATPTPVSNSAARPALNTYRWLCAQYLRSPEFKRLDASTQRVRRRILEVTWAEPTEPGATTVFADFPVQRFTAKAVKVLRDRKGARVEAANSRVKALRQVFAWAIEQELVAANPARDVRYLTSGSTGFPRWSVDEVAQFEAHHPIGTKARLALALLMFTGQRRSDVVLFGRQHVRGGYLQFTQTKNRNRNPVTLQIPVLPVLQDIIDRSPTGDLTFLVTEFGRPFTANGFGNKMREWCNEAGLPRCSAHGLRKASATIAAENGATPHQLMAIFGWRTLKEAERYTREAGQKKLAGAAMGLLVRTEDRTNLSHFGSASDPGGKESSKK